MSADKMFDVPISGRAQHAIQRAKSCTGCTEADVVATLVTWFAQLGPKEQDSILAVAAQVAAREGIPAVTEVSAG